MSESKKLVEHSIMLARNEAEDIIGAVKEGLFFAEKVWVIIDPESTDDTEKIIKRTFRTRRVHIEYQIKDIEKIKQIDPSAADIMYDEGFDGHLVEDGGKLFAHWNITYWVNQIVKSGEWWHWISPDERFAPRDYYDIWFWVRYAQQFGYEAVWTVDHLFTRDEVTGERYNWCIWFQNPGTPHHFLKMSPNGWKKGLTIHSGCTLPDTRKRYKMPINHYHFAYCKDSRHPFQGPRDHREFQFQPRYQYYNPMGDGWRDLPDVDNNGNLLPASATIQVDLPHTYIPRVTEIKQMMDKITPLYDQVTQKYKEVEKLDVNLKEVQKKLVEIQVEITRLIRVKGWRLDEITQLEQQITEAEKML